MEEEGRSGKLSDQSEVLLHCSVTISNSESFMSTHNTVIETLFLLYSIPCTTPFPSTNGNLETACSSAWVQIPFSFLHNEAEVSHNQVLQKEHQ